MMVLIVLAVVLVAASAASSVSSSMTAAERYRMGLVTPPLKKKSIFRGIFPGTKWCGAGNIAKNYAEVATGAGAKADLCCREHDQCPKSIPAWRYKYGIWNWRFYTISHCDCDNAFRDCLQGNKDTLVSDIVGHTFFNVLRTSCFTSNRNIASTRYNP